MLRDFGTVLTLAFAAGLGLGAAYIGYAAAMTVIELVLLRMVL